MTKSQQPNSLTSAPKIPCRGTQIFILTLSLALRKLGKDKEMNFHFRSFVTTFKKTYNKSREFTQVTTEKSSHFHKKKIFSKKRKSRNKKIKPKRNWKSKLHWNMRQKRLLNCKNALRKQIKREIKSKMKWENA